MNKKFVMFSKYCVCQIAHFANAENVSWQHVLHLAWVFPGKYANDYIFYSLNGPILCIIISIWFLPGMLIFGIQGDSTYPWPSSFTMQLAIAMISQDSEGINFITRRWSCTNGRYLWSLYEAQDSCQCRNSLAHSRMKVICGFIIQNSFCWSERSSPGWTCLA